MSDRDIYERGFDEDDGRTTSTTTCPECAERLRTDGGETSCLGCGLVLDRHNLNHSGEFQGFDDNGHSKERTGPPLTAARHDRGLSSEIGWKIDGHGNDLSERKRRQLRRLRREHSRGRWQDKTERNLAAGFGSISRLCSALDLPKSLREQACTLFRRAQNEDLLRGRSIEAIAAGCVYAGCRLTGMTRTVEEVGEYARVDIDRVLHAYRLLNDRFALPTLPRTPMDFLPTIAGEFDLPPAVTNRAHEIAREAHESGANAGKHPAGFAGTCLRLVAAEFGLEVLQKDIAAAAGVSAATVRHNQDVVRSLLEDCP